MNKVSIILSWTLISMGITRPQECLSQINNCDCERVFFLKNSSSKGYLNVCSENDNQYFRVDKSGIISWFENQSYCPKYNTHYDTIIRENGDVEIRTKNVLVTEVAKYKFKFSMKQNSIYLLKIDPLSDKTSLNAYCNLNGTTSQNRVGVFSNNGDEFSVTLVNKDTTIRFKKLEFNCYKIIEFSSDASGSYSDVLFVDKISLVPVYRETIVDRKQLFSAEGKIHQVRSYILAGILYLD